MPPPPLPTLFPYTTLFRSTRPPTVRRFFALANQHMRWQLNDLARRLDERPAAAALPESGVAAPPDSTDRKSTRLNSSHLGISYAVFCLKKKKQIKKRM